MNIVANKSKFILTLWLKVSCLLHLWPHPACVLGVVMSGLWVFSKIRPAQCLFALAGHGFSAYFRLGMPNGNDAVFTAYTCKLSKDELIWLQWWLNWVRTKDSSACLEVCTSATTPPLPAAVWLSADSDSTYVLPYLSPELHLIVSLHLCHHVTCSTRTRSNATRPLLQL